MKNTQKETQETQETLLRTQLSRIRSKLVKVDDEEYDEMIKTIKTLKMELAKLTNNFQDKCTVTFGKKNHNGDYLVEGKFENKVWQTMIHRDDATKTYWCSNIAGKTATLAEMKSEIKNHIEFMWETKLK